MSIPFNELSKLQIVFDSCICVQFTLLDMPLSGYAHLCIYAYVVVVLGEMLKIMKSKLNEIYRCAYVPRKRCTM